MYSTWQRGVLRWGDRKVDAPAGCRALQTPTRAASSEKPSWRSWTPWMKTQRAPLLVPPARQTPRITTYRRPGSSKLLSCNASFPLEPLHECELTLWWAMLHCVRDSSCLASIVDDQSGWSACHQYARYMTEQAEQDQAVSVRLCCSRLMLMGGARNLLESLHACSEHLACMCLRRGCAAGPGGGGRA